MFYTLLSFLLIKLCYCINLDPTSKVSICNATALIQKGILDYYEGTHYGGTVGMFQPPYYWWQAGEVFGGMLDDWFLCQNNTFETLIYDAMIAQTGADYDYMPVNQTMVEGNDDQAMWGLTIMTAVERNFTNPTKDIPGWLSMTQAVFNTMYSRWDSSHCGGGLRWQIFTWNSGYNYKNTIANGCLFQIAARLGRYTGNHTYLHVADRIWDWLVDVEFIVLSDKTNIYDGAPIEGNCTDITKLEWTYNHGVILGGAAYMYNATNGSAIWEARIRQIMGGATSLFFQDGIMYEMACQNSGTCNNDQRSFKAILARMMGLASVLAPFSKEILDPLIETSAAAAALSCSGGTDGHTCGLNWELKKWDGMYGLGEQDCALEMIHALLVNDRPAPYTAYSGGSSSGNPEAGLNKISTNVLEHNLNITTKDRAGAAIITTIVICVLLAGAIWMML